MQHTDMVTTGKYCRVGEKVKRNNLNEMKRQHTE